MLDPLCGEDQGGTPEAAGTACTAPEARRFPDDTCEMLEWQRYSRPYYPLQCVRREVHLPPENRRSTFRWRGRTTCPTVFLAPADSVTDPPGTAWQSVDAAGALRYGYPTMTEPSVSQTPTGGASLLTAVALEAAAPRPTVNTLGAYFRVTTLTTLLLFTSGCVTRTSTFQIVDYRKPGDAARYQEAFDEAYYNLDGEGNMDIVLRRIEPTRAGRTSDLTQVIHLRTVWRSIPGRTVAERTQINGTVSYLIVHGRTGAAFEGAGSVFFREDRGKDTLRGSLDQAILKPTRSLPEGGHLFHRAELSGEFRAVRDRRKVVRIINDMNRLFGPLPLREG